MRRWFMLAAGVWTTMAGIARADTPPPFPTLTAECIAQTASATAPDFRKCVTLSAFACAKEEPMLICLGREYEVWDATVALRYADVVAYAREHDAEWPMYDALEQAQASWVIYAVKQCHFHARTGLGGSGEQEVEAFCLLHLMADRMHHLEAL